MLQDPAQATAIVALARGWIGTPYHHQASVQGVGCDCLGPVRGVYRQYTGRDPETPPPYSRDWAEASGIETMLAAAWPPCSRFLRSSVGCNSRRANCTASSAPAASWWNTPECRGLLLRVMDPASGITQRLSSRPSSSDSWSGEPG
jgi:hypothetical protein